MRTYLWYVSPNVRFTAQGEHQQAAFDALRCEQRAQVINAEFCTEIDPTKGQASAPYLTLLKIRGAAKE